jgi:hypothetical protein
MSKTSCLESKTTVQAEAVVESRVLCGSTACATGDTVVLPKLGHISGGQERGETCCPSFPETACSSVC